MRQICHHERLELPEFHGLAAVGGHWETICTVFCRTMFAEGITHRLGSEIGKRKGIWAEEVQGGTTDKESNTLVESAKLQ